MTFPRIEPGTDIVLDYETTGVHFWKDRAFSFAIATPDLSTWYYDVRDTPTAVDWLRDLLPTCSRVGAHNAKFEAHFTRELTGLTGVPWHCTMIRAALLNEHEPTYELDFLARKYVGEKKDSEIYPELAAIFGGRPTRNVQMPNLHKAPAEIVGRYAKQDALATMKLLQWQDTKIAEVQEVYDLEMQLLHVLVEMEEYGVLVDVDRATRAVRDITVKADELQYELNRLAGFEVNPNPSGSITKLFQPHMEELDGNQVWRLVDGTIADSTEGGKASINADCLRRMKHPAARMILDLRKMLKTRDTFLSGHILGHQQDGIIHCNFNQTKNDDEAGTGTGRLSVTAPALQQIPSRDKAIKAIVRPIFLPDEGADWLGMDWSQFEFRVANHYGKVPEILDAYRKDPNLDFHQLVSDMTGIPRNAQYAGGPSSKAINLGLAFNMGSGRLAQECGLPYTEESTADGKVYLKAGPEAMAIFEKYHAANPGMRNMAQSASAIARERGYVRSILGRRLRFPGGQFVHKASGLIYQATSADCMKLKIIELHRYLRDTQAGRLLLSVHDEVGISLEKDADPRPIADIYTTFDGEKCPIKLRVPITCEWGVGKNWYEAKD